MKKRLIGITVGLSLGTMLMGTMAASASPASVSGSSIKAVVVSQSCTAGGSMMVKLSAINVSHQNGSATSTPTRYTWSLSSDGQFWTPLSLSPAASHVYAKSASGTATAIVKAFGGTSNSGGKSSVTFSTVCA
jgi:hypothetical protein